jgi:hypothetical protein
MWRRVSVLAFGVVAVVATGYGVVSAFGIAGIVIPAVVLGLLWIVARDLRRTPWSSARHTAHDTAYNVAAIAAFHAASQSSTECTPGFDGYSGCGDAGGV